MNNRDAPPGYVLLEARHVDALTGSVRALTTMLARLEPLFKKLGMDVEAVVANTSDIPRLLAVLTQKATNGDADAFAEKENET